MEMEGDCSCSEPQDELLGEQAIGELLGDSEEAIGDGELSDEVFEPPQTAEAPEEAKEDGGKKELVKDR